MPREGTENTETVRRVDDGWDRYAGVLLQPPQEASLACGAVRRLAAAVRQRPPHIKYLAAVEHDLERLRKVVQLCVRESVGIGGGSGVWRGRCAHLVARTLRAQTRADDGAA